MKDNMRILLEDYVDRSSKYRIKEMESDIIERLSKLNSMIGEEYEPTSQDRKAAKEMKKSVYELCDKIFKRGK